MSNTEIKVNSLIQGLFILKTPQHNLLNINNIVTPTICGKYFHPLLNICSVWRMKGTRNGLGPPSFDVHASDFKKFRSPSKFVLEADGLKKNLPSAVLHRPTSAFIPGRSPSFGDPRSGAAIFIVVIRDAHTRTFVLAPYSRFLRRRRTGYKELRALRVRIEVRGTVTFARTGVRSTKGLKVRMSVPGDDQNFMKH